MANLASLCGIWVEPPILSREKRKIGYWKQSCKHVFELCFTSKRFRPVDIALDLCTNIRCDSSLLTDPKSRKVILVEHPLLPLHIKDAFARILFNNLQVDDLVNVMRPHTHNVQGTIDLLCEQSFTLAHGRGQTHGTGSRLWAP